MPASHQLRYKQEEAGKGSEQENRPLEGDEGELQQVRPEERIPGADAAWLAKNLDFLRSVGSKVSAS